METRTIDLIKNPETLKVEDLKLLETEIEKFPYMQSLRAIYLLGIHRFYNENFSKELTRTAAYTTDKRVLYNFINTTNENDTFFVEKELSKIEQTPIVIENEDFKAEEITNISIEEENIEQNNFTNENQLIETNEELSVEDSSYEDKSMIDEEETVPDTSPIEKDNKSEPNEYEKKKHSIDEYIASEMAKLKSENAAENNVAVQENTETSEPIITETVEKEEKILAEELSLLEENVEIQTSTPEQKFHTEEDFISPETFHLKEPKEVTIDFYNKKQTKSTEEEVPTQREYYYSSTKPNSESPAENETKETTIDFYAKKQTAAYSDEEAHTDNNDSSGGSNPSSIMDFYSSKKVNSEIEEENNNHSSICIYERPINLTEKYQKDEETEINKNPIDFYASKSISIQKTENKSAESSPLSLSEESITESKNSDSKEEKTIYNKQEIEPEKTLEPIKTTTSSNVISFISTWKNWLKIDNSEKTVLSEQDKKAAIIDKFIENNPKISPIKEDVDFVVKEKNNDISHLMTETLAQLYVEQKLYTKAIHAYKILQEKYPERTAEFEEKIEEIKKTRNIK